MTIAEQICRKVDYLMGYGNFHALEFHHGKDIKNRIKQDKDFFIQFIDDSVIEARFIKFYGEVAYYRWQSKLILPLDLISNKCDGLPTVKKKHMSNQDILKQIAELTKQLGAADKEALVAEIQNPSLSAEEVEDRKNQIRAKLDEISGLMSDLKYKLTVKSFDDSGIPVKIIIRSFKPKVKLSKMTDEEWQKVLPGLPDPFKAADASAKAEELGFINRKVSLMIKEQIGKTVQKVAGTAGPKTAYNKIVAKKGKK